MSEKQPKITVLMSVYNSRPHLDECIKSVLTQSFTDFEFLILDDCSSDTSKEIILSYNDRRIRLVENSTNMGLAASLNKGLKLARGEYIARMDADDICHKERLKKQTAYLDAHRDIGVCGTFFRWIRNGKKSSRIIKMPLSDCEIKAELLFKNALAHPTVMIRAAVLKKNGISYRENYSNSQDYALWVDIRKKTGFANLPEVLLFYRLHEKQISATKSPKDGLFVKEIQGRLLEDLGVTGEKALEKHYRLFLEEKSSGTNNKKTSGTKEYLFSMLRYLSFLIRQNRKARVYDENALLKMAGKRWFSLCSLFGARGEKTFGLYRRARLAAFYKPSFKEIIRFFVRSFL